MKPVAILQHTEVGAPGTVPSIIETLGRPVNIIRIVDGERVPADASSLGGVISLGGYMSVHDDLPWIPQELALIRDAAARGLPVAGHCLGSQLVAFALGGSVHRHTHPEIGWNDIVTADDATAHEWWGEYAGRTIETFQWHGDTFVAPPGARQLASAAYCENQVFVVDDRHLMMQSHLEMTLELVELSLERNGAQLVREHAKGNPAVTSFEETRRELPMRTAAMHAILSQLYSQWILRCP